MNIIKNLPAITKIGRAILTADKRAKEIDKARAEGRTEDELRIIAETCHVWADTVARDFDLRVNLINPKNMPSSGPVVFISNHQGYADILCFLKCVPFQCSFIAKDGLKKIPHFGRWVERTRGLYIAREDVRSSLNTINEGVSFVKNGFSLCIFPEGTRSRSSEMGEFHPGSFKLATKAKAPIVPVTVNGSYRAFEETGIAKNGVTIDMTIHKPIDVASLDRAELSELPEKVREIIESAL